MDKYPYSTTNLLSRAASDQVAPDAGIIEVRLGGPNGSGGGTRSLVGCDIFANATNTASIDITRGGTLQADNIVADGGASGNLTANRKLTTNKSSATPDPYATTRSIPGWSITGPDATTSVSGSVSNPTGVKVQRSGITISGTTTFAADQSNPSTDTGVFDCKTGCTLNLTAPTAGTTAGISSWADAQLPP